MSLAPKPCRFQLIDGTSLFLSLSETCFAQAVNIQIVQNLIQQAFVNRIAFVNLAAALKFLGLSCPILRN